MKRTVTTLAAAFLTFTLMGCTNPATFKAVGVYDGSKYNIEVIRGKEAFNPPLSVLLNGEEAMRITKVNMFKDPNCKKTTVSSWRCKYSTNFNNMELVVVEEINTTLASNSLNYDVYLDGEYVQRVVAALY